MVVRLVVAHDVIVVFVLGLVVVDVVVIIVDCRKLYCHTRLHLGLSAKLKI